MSLLVEAVSPTYGFERFSVKIIKKYNIRPEQIMPKYRTRPGLTLSGIVIGKNITYETARDYVQRYFSQSGEFEVLSMRLKR